MRGRRHDHGPHSRWRRGPRNSARRRATASCAAMRARCCAASGRGGRAPARATPTRTAQLVRTDPVLLMQRTLDEDGKVVAFAGSPGRDWDGAPLDPGAHVRHRRRRRHHLSRLQAGALHRLGRARRRRHRHGRHRGHLQLLRRQGEDRHRPAPRPRDGGDPRQGRAGRPRHDRRVRLADAVHRRRAAPDRRLQEGGQRHLRRAARSVLRQRRWR